MPKAHVVLGEVKENFTSGSLRRVGVAIAAVTLILVGAIGVFIPLFPGRATMLAGLLLLSVHSPSLHALVKRKTQNHPRLQSRADRLRNWLINRIHR